MKKLILLTTAITLLGGISAANAGGVYINGSIFAPAPAYVVEPPPPAYVVEPYPYYGRPYYHDRHYYDWKYWHDHHRGHGNPHWDNDDRDHHR